MRLLKTLFRPGDVVCLAWKVFHCSGSDPHASPVPVVRAACCPAFCWWWTVSSVTQAQRSPPACWPRPAWRAAVRPAPRERCLLLCQSASRTRRPVNRGGFLATPPHPRCGRSHHRHGYGRWRSCRSCASRGGRYRWASPAAAPGHSDGLRARLVRATVVVITRSAISCGLRLMLPMCLRVSPSMPPRT